MGVTNDQAKEDLENLKAFLCITNNTECTRHIPYVKDYAADLLDAREQLSNRKLFCFQPRGHGEQSAFVIAENEEQARSMVREQAKAQCFDEYDIYGFDTDYYNVTVVEFGTVVFNDNE